MPRSPRFEFDKEKGQYLWQSGPNRGRRVPQQAVRGALDEYLKNKTEEVAEICEKLRNREISAATWQREMERNLAKIHLNSAALAKGGKERMTGEDLARVGELIKSELGGVEGRHGGLRGLMNAMNGDGENEPLPLDGRWMQRVRQYAQAGRHTFHTIETQERQSNGFDEQRFILHAGDSCDECVALAARGWHPTGSTPEPGGRTCRRNCRCTKEYRNSPAANEEGELNGELSSLGELPPGLHKVAGKVVSKATGGLIAPPAERQDGLRPVGNRIEDALKLDLPLDNSTFLGQQLDQESDLSRAQARGKAFMRGVRIVDSVVRLGNRKIKNARGEEITLPVRPDEAGTGRTAAAVFDKKYLKDKRGKLKKPRERRYYPTHLLYSLSSEMLEFGAAHEVAHLYATALYPGFDISTEPGLSGVVQEWKNAVYNSRGFSELQKTIAQAKNNLSTDPEERALQRRKIKYYSSDEELWGRAFAQYVATKSGDPTMLSQLQRYFEAETDSDEEINWAVVSQWKDPKDFESISQAFDKLFQREGCLQ